MVNSSCCLDMSEPNKKRHWLPPLIPPDLVALFGLLFFPVIAAMMFGFIMAPLFRARRGDPAILYLACGIAAIGIVLLLFARLPLYRQGRFFTFGARLLDDRHRRLYRCAYAFITLAMLLLGLLHIALL
jgi:hypothetical protein